VEETASIRQWPRLKAATLLAAAVLGAVVALDATTWALFRWPKVWVERLPKPAEQLLRAYHRAFLGGGPVQFRPACSEADSELLYRLKAGRCRFATDEFDTTVRVSPRHLREDIEIRDPDIVVLGDSFSLGWGVEREQAYPAVLAQSLGVRAVVAADSSYGTVRELLLLRRLALSDFRAIVVQYYANDAGENQAFLRAGRHQPSPPSAYSQAVDVWERVNSKQILKHSRHWLSMALSSLNAPPPGPPSPTAAEQAGILLQVLDAFAPDLRGRPLLVFDADRGPESSEFARAFNSFPKPPGLGRSIAIDPTRELKPSDYFTLDLHWRPNGHQIIAGAITGPLAELLLEGRPQP
jgi:lysophospholipase L1-like esterase